MLARPEGPDPPQTGAPWTCADVEVWLKFALRQMRYTAIYAPRGNTLQSLTPGSPSATFDIVAFSGTVLGRGSLEHRIVLLWARAIATEGEVGGSIAEYCRERRWDRSTFDRRRKRACIKIAEAKNRADGR